MNLMKKTVAYLVAIMLPAAPAIAVSFPSQSSMPLSQYGMIQNVQNYSSNPYWNPDSPYNQRFPTPVYAQGTDLTAADCQAVVAQLVASHCGALDNCAGVRLSDVRAPLMVQLSKMSGYNYVSACGGFIDEAFNSYVSQYGSAVRNTVFPTAVNPGNNIPGPEFKIENPYAPKMPSWGKDQWFKGIVDRTIELETLQSQNGGGNERLAKAYMPTTIADLSFTERLENTRQGYADAAAAGLVNSSYKTIEIESDEKRRERELAEANHRKKLADLEKQMSGSDPNSKEHVKVILKSLIKK
jgi:hypothetical protein